MKNCRRTPQRAPRFGTAARCSFIPHIHHARTALIINMRQLAHAHTSRKRGNCPAMEHGR